jgi:peptidyl-prolyl cis-trans isomerase C
MKWKFGLTVALAATTILGQAQVASHSPVLKKQAPQEPQLKTTTIIQPTGKPVAKVNGVVLTDRDLLREMMTIFPYARTHNGFPKGQEEMIRKGALSMIEFEELVYQEAVRRQMTVPPEKLKRAENAFRSNFQTDEEFEQYLKVEMNGSHEQFNKMVRRSLLIEAYQKARLDIPSKVTLAEAHAYYDKNPMKYKHGELVQFQTISVLPPENATADVKDKARKLIHEVWDQAKKTKSYEDFGLLAEKYSEDDFRVNMGDHKLGPRGAVPEPVQKILDAMHPGQVSDICQFGPYYAIFRLNLRKPAGLTPFAEVKSTLLDDMHKMKYDKLRGDLDKKLRASAKVEEF